MSAANESVERVFDQRGTFAAMNAVERFARETGFSLGTHQRGAPRAVLFGDAIIGKWRNLRKFERDQMHGEVVGDGREGPLTFRLFASAPEAARAALRLATGETE